LEYHEKGIGRIEVANSWGDNGITDSLAREQCPPELSGRDLDYGFLYTTESPALTSGRNLDYRYYPPVRDIYSMYLIY
jgi:hypothetical protein